MLEPSDKEGIEGMQHNPGRTLTQPVGTLQLVGAGRILLLSAARNLGSLLPRFCCSRAAFTWVSLVR